MKGVNYEKQKWFKSIIPIILAVVIIMTAIPKAQATEEYLDFEEEIAAKARATEASEKLME